MKKIFIISILFVISLFAAGGMVGAEANEKVNWDGKVKEVLEINQNLKISKMEDGRVKPVNINKLKDLEDKDLNEILIFMNYTDAIKIPRDTKLDIITTGGKGVDSTEYNLKVETFDEDGKLISNEKIELGKGDKEFSAFALPSATGYCFSVGCFDGNLGISYVGKSGTNYQYRFYYYYNWDGMAPYYHTDRIGLAWSSDGKKKAGSDYGTHYAWMENLGYYVQRTMTVNKTSVYGTVLNVPVFLTDHQYGSQKVDVYYPSSSYSDIEIIQGKYAHNWQTIANAVTIGPAAISVSNSYKTFTLEKNFTVGK